MNTNEQVDMSTPNRTQNSEKSFLEPLTFVAVFTNVKLVPKRVEFLNILHKVQVVELLVLSYNLSINLVTTP